jgi:hypothetical protein
LQLKEGDEKKEKEKDAEFFENRNQFDFLRRIRRLFASLRDR